jgi:hypothetical protein
VKSVDGANTEDSVVLEEEEEEEEEEDELDEEGEVSIMAE